MITALDITALDLPSPVLDAETKLVFEKCVAKFGFVPNVLQAYSHDGEKLKGFSGLYNNLMLAPSGLTKLEREMIAVVVSAINHCPYCLAAHGAAVREMSGDAAFGDLLIYNYRKAPMTDKQRAMLDFAALITENSAMIEEEDREDLRDHGFSDQDIWDISAVAAFFNMSNRMASAIDMKPNKEYFNKGR
jgi:uncharacterized peroxidase-related enzyme